MLESSSIILPCSHKSDFVDLLSVSGVPFTFLLLLIPDIVEDIVILKISLEYLNEQSVGLSTYSGDVILHMGGSRKGEQTAPSDHLLALPGRHNSQVQLVTFSPVTPLRLPTTDSKKLQIFPPVIRFFSGLCEEHFLLWHFSIYISPNCFIKVLFVCFPQMCTPLNVSI